MKYLVFQNQQFPTYFRTVPQVRTPGSHKQINNKGLFLINLASDAAERRLVLPVHLLGAVRDVQEPVLLLVLVVVLVNLVGVSGHEGFAALRVHDQVKRLPVVELQPFPDPHHELGELGAAANGEHAGV